MLTTVELLLEGKGKLRPPLEISVLLGLKGSKVILPHLRGNRPSIALARYLAVHCRCNRVPILAEGRQGIFERQLYGSFIAVNSNRVDEDFTAELETQPGEIFR